MQIVRKFGAATLAATLAVAVAMPVSAMPLSAASQSQSGVSSPFVLAQYGGGYRRGDRDDGPRYRGYRGSREYRRGYRRHRDGWWYPLAAFGLGIGIGSALAPPRYVAPRSGSAHVDWCYSRYRSYRAWDNTYQPYDGPRRQCYSPYG